MRVKRIKIFLVIPSLHKGGAERVMSILANHLDKKQFDIKLILLKKRGSYLKTLSKEIHVIDLQSENVKKSFFPLLRIIKKEQPDIIFSALGHLNLLMSFIKFFVNKNIKFIARETNIPSIINKYEKHPILFNILYKVLYSRFDVIVCQSNDMAKDLIKHYGINKEKIIIINNPVDTVFIRKKLEESALLPYPYQKEKFNFVSIGSLEYRKGFDLLLESWCHLENRENKTLTIIGNGSLKKELQEKINKYNLYDSVRLLDFQDNPYFYMANADMFILSSRYEGFPNVLLESLACGTPVIAFDCPGDINKIIFQGKNGWLVKANDVKELASLIEKHPPVFYSRKRIVEDVEKNFSVKSIIHFYEKIFFKTKEYNESV